MFFTRCALLLRAVRGIGQRSDAVFINALLVLGSGSSRNFSMRMTRFGRRETLLEHSRGVC